MHADPPSRDNTGFLLAKASQRWNEVLSARFVARGFPEVRPAYGSLLLPLFEEDGVRLGELARRARLSKQTMTALIRRLERDGLVALRADPSDARATLVFLTARAHEFEPVAAEVLEELDRQVAALLPAPQVRLLGEALRALMELERASPNAAEHRADVATASPP